MGTVNPTQSNAGDTIEAADINTPVNQLAAVINGSIDANNLADGAVTTNKLADSNVTEPKLTHRPSTYIFDHVASGLVWTGDALGSTRAASMSLGVVYIGGKYLTVGLVSARTFTASKDTYVDVLDAGNGTGTLVYTEATNNAASPALAASSVRIGIIVTGATTIAAATSINQGQETMVLPIASSIPYAVTDSLGNLICSRDPNRKQLGYRQSIVSTNSSGTASTQIVALSLPLTLPLGRKAKFTIFTPSCTSGSANSPQLEIWDGTVGSGTQLTVGLGLNVNGAVLSVTGSVPVTGTGSLKTFNGAIKQPVAGTATTAGTATQPSYLMVELE